VPAQTLGKRFAVSGMTTGALRHFVASEEGGQSHRFSPFQADREPGDVVL
jgi:hypothetical protein